MDGRISTAVPRSPRRLSSKDNSSCFLKRRRRRRRSPRWMSVAVFCWACSSESAVFRKASASASISSSAVGYQSVQSSCQRRLVQVHHVILTCDSPSAYYQGSNTYRKSQVCMSQDKANLSMEFSVAEGIDDEYVSVTIESGLYDRYNTVVNNQNICTLGTVIQTSDSNNDDNDNNNNNGNSACPAAGRYELTTSFTVPSARDYDFHYTPDLRFLFVDNEGRRLGCATTGARALHQSSDRHAQNGMVALGLAVLIFIGLFGSLLYLSYRRKEQLRLQQLRKVQYFSTLPNGQVVAIHDTNKRAIPLPMSKNPVNNNRRQQQEQHQRQPSPEFQISNPSYNEPQVPTRPIL